jgi:type I restriction enzyme S subunit
VSQVRPKPNRLTADNADGANTEKNSRLPLPSSPPCAKSAVKNSEPEIAAEPPALPRGWANVTIQDVCFLNPGLPLRLSPDADVSFVPMAAASEVGQITSRHIRKFREVAKGYTPFVNDDVLWAKITPCMENGKSAIASDLTNGTGFGSTEFFVLRSNGSILPEFLHRFIRQKRFRTAARKTMNSAVGQARVPKSFLLSSPIPLPPLAEQRRIVARLEALEARSRRARALLAEVPAQLAQARQSLLAAAFRGDLTAEWRNKNQSTESGAALLDRLRTERRKHWETAELRKMRARGKVPIDDTWKSRYVEPSASDCTDLLPATWTWACLIELEEGDRKSGYGVLKPGPHEPTGIRMLKSGQIRHGWVDLSEDYRISAELDAEFAKTRLRGGEVLINLVGASIGRSAVAPAETAGCNLSRAIGMIPVPRQIAVYVQFVLGSPVCQRLIIEKTGGSAQGVLNMEEVRSLAIPLPPEAEQDEIVRRLTAALARLDAAARAHAAAVADLDRLDQSLLARAFSGTLVPQDPAD